MGDDSKKTGSVRSSGVSAAHESGGASGNLQVGGSNLGERVDESVGAPISGGMPGAISLPGFATGGVRLLRRHPNKFPAGHYIGKIVSNSMGKHVPNPGQGSGMMRGAAHARRRRGEERLAVSADGGYEGELQMTNWSAQASAAAAVSHEEGGHPTP